MKGITLDQVSEASPTWGVLFICHVVIASTLFGEPFADVKPQEIGALMTIGSLNFPRPPPGQSGMVSTNGNPMPLGDEGDFAPIEIERMALACLKNVEAALERLEGWRQQGHALEEIYVHGLAPCARLLGHWWRCDIADFAQVTIGSSNLQRLLHRMSHEFCAPGADQPAGLSVLLATEPQSQHTMGAFMLAEFFRRRGWRVQLLAPHDSEEVLHHLRRDWFDALGVSVSTGRQLQALQALLPRLRQEAPNARLSVLVGGPLAVSDPQALQSLEVDLLGGNARETVNQLGQLVVARKN